VLFAVAFIAKSDEVNALTHGGVNETIG